MTNAELEKLLKSAPAPERPPEYWEQFPQRVAARAAWREPADTPAQPGKPTAWLWGLGFAGACVLLGFALGFWRGQSSTDVSASLALAQKYFREIAPLFPHQLQAISFDRQGARLVLAETPSLPDCPPIFISIRAPGGCENFVTFSGQQIRINGDVFEVLVDRKGDVMVVGRQWVWSSASGASSANPYQITAKPLGRTS